ncbi:aldehyde dehydrogenase family protein [Halalkalibacter okhensis]|uniref:3-sulfolactaldehyde dehydrogenase n=1 Tax=Halalkalibacter okhensis TaxID=333138 RepID=A0A0B0I7P8_9BACI|nr:aldehyde dehydrogenase family protein [Halalkalibacter okhensis]KHF38478.1 aldehyde dehydrogenase [Halalkalibacter okhensis]
MINVETVGTNMFLAGKWVNRSNIIEVRDPEDNRLLTTVPAASKEDMLEAIDEAKVGLKIASNMSVHQRVDILNKAADYIESHLEEYAITIASEGSKTIREARKEASRCVQTIRLSAEEARRITGETISFDQAPGSEGRQGYYTRIPIGIIGAITPFNDPLNLVAHKVGPAIASGNAIIVKPATATPLSALKLAEAFEAAGLPDKVLSVVTGYGYEIGDTLVTHPDVRMISFTGGVEAGLAITQKAGLKKLSMELGSNSPGIVLADANMIEAVEANVSGAFWAAGQNCLGVQRLYVEQTIFELFVEEFVARTQEYRLGNKLSEETDMGPLISEKEAIRVESWVEEAVLQGARLLCGGKRNGASYEPTVLMDVPDHCTIAREEVFGPVVLLYAVSNIKEAIERSNSVHFGLQAGVFTNNLEYAFQASEQLEVGGVMINDSSDYRIDGMPFGGVKASGLGREGVQFTIHEMTEPKVICFKLNKQ